jgi:acyl-CoA synthetase (AMP-forming)/AMP-acid ligase II/acyl carrier protein
VYSQSQTLIELLRSRTHQQSDRQAYTFLVDEGVVETTLTYGELDQRARSIAARLQSIVEVGDRVLLLYPPGLEYIAAFFGCLYAGAIAVPAYPPRNNRNLHRLQTLVQNAEAAVSLTTSPILSRIAPHVSQNSYLAPLVWQATDQIPDWVANDWREPSISGDSLAFLQYTSGSTSAPKGVMVSHQNLLHNERLIQSVFQQTDQSVIVGWLPLYHDMGLIGNVIQPLFVGAPCILMSPMAFLQRPVRWLQAISRYRATTSGGPNFAYDLCVRKINDEQRAGLDLSSWQVAFNGAEPVRQETLERFAAAFAPCGFKFDAFRPCYGLAEATLLVSGRTGNEPLVATTVQAGALEAGHAIKTTSAEDAYTLVNCGGASAQDKVVIVDPKTLTECAPGAVGEIWVAGPGVAQGYWNDPAETDRIFRAYLPENGDGPFLRTEDLGFLLDGKLFVTGRLKDLIIIRGLNHYPQDIELTVERCHTALRPGCCAAFSVEVAGEERLVIVQEVDQRRQFRAETVIESINEAVAREHELQAHAIVLVTPGTVPKTSSGKIQRFACREAFLSGALEVVAEQRGIEYTPAKLEDELAIPDRHDRQAVELWLRAQVAGKLNVELQQVDVGQPLTRYGLDSLAAIELAHGVESNFEIAVPLTAFLEGANIAELATRVVEQQQVNSGEQRRPAGEPIARTSAPLSVGQRALWFLQQVDPESAAYNLSGALRVLSPLDVPALQRAFQQLMKRHVSLRTTFPSRDGEPAVSVHEDVEVDFIVHDSSAWDDAALSQYLTDEAHRPFDLEAGPLLRVRLLSRVFSRRGQEQVLLLCLHHIIADQWSLAVLLNELGVLYEAECTAALVTLPDLRSQYADYARWQEKLLSGEFGERLLSYWKKQLAGELPNLNLPTDRPYPPVQTYHGASHLFRLNAELTRSLKEVSYARDATLYMTLLAAFQVLLHGYTDQEDILIGSPSAGRSLAEFANVVGYFVNPLVIRADLAGNSTFEAVLSRTRQTVLEAFEHQDYPFPLLTERLQPARDASRSPIFQVMFSMQNTPLGSGDGLTALAVGEPGAKLQLGQLHLESLPLEQQSAMFDITLRMAEVEGELLASLQYNTDLFDPATITRMAEHFQTLLDGIVNDPSRHLSELPLLTSAESRLLAEWNKTDRDYDQPYCLHELFEQQVERSPEAVALVFEGKRLYYAELNELANQLASRLRQVGVKPETRIGLCVERSFEMVIGLLGILKAGGAFVPLNPSDPPERLSFMFEDAGAQVLLTQKRFGHLLSANRAHVIYLDEPYVETGPMTGSSVDVCPENLAYVIYTSGSTGQPKGAMNAHKAIVNRLLWAQEAYALCPADCVLQKRRSLLTYRCGSFSGP